MTKPNLILITADEMRADCAGFLGSSVCRTPHLDRLAARGAVFERHFTVHGKCVPSRAAMLTGRYTHTDGHRAINHACTIPDGVPNLHLALKNAGYQTAFFGHNHTHENLLNGKNGPGENIADYHSFSDGVFVGMLSREWPSPAQTYFPPPVANACLETRCKTAPRSGFCDDNRADQVVEYLERVRDRSRPFYLHLNFGLPHPPYEVEEPYFSMYDRGALEPYPFALPENAPLHLRKMREVRGAGVDEVAVREIMAVYFGMISKVDTLIGRVLEAVERQGLFENTVVLFTSDHGDFAGQYGLPEKWDTAMQDCIMRVPMILCAPGISPGRKVGSLTEHVDIPPTVLELVGIAPGPEWGIHGDSLVPAMRGGAGKRYVFADGGHEDAMRARFNTEVEQRAPDGTCFLATQGKQKVYHDFPQTMSRTKMVRSEAWKLVVRLEGGNELYHVAEDPFEMVNLYGRPEHAGVVAQLMEQLVLWSLRTDTDRPFLESVGA